MKQKGNKSTLLPVVLKKKITLQSQMFLIRIHNWILSKETHITSKCEEH